MADEANTVVEANGVAVDQAAVAAAEAFKDKGNEYFKLKKYRLAVRSPAAVLHSTAWHRHPSRTRVATQN